MILQIEHASYFLRAEKQGLCSPKTFSYNTYCLGKMVKNKHPIFVAKD